MFKSIDLKSLLIGGLLVLVVLSCLGAVPWLEQDRFGRFAVGTTDDGAIILDTASGQAWVYAFGPTLNSGIPSTEEFFLPKLSFEPAFDRAVP